MQDAADPSGAMAGHDSRVAAATNYRRWAIEVGDRSPAYAVLAEQVAGDAQILAFLDGLTASRRQPNLLFASARCLLGAPANLTTLRDLVSQRRPSRPQ